MTEKKNEIAEGVSLKDAIRMRELYKEIGRLPYNSQVALIKMAANRAKGIKLAAEVNAFEVALYEETWMRAKGRPHR